ncbi:MAG: SMC-Scp complex subunit ScpB [Patescibacteria group bacterium]|nr:SMC-Scp complex subunit ScpB [Patescibacteria group bacterium]
MSLKSSLEAILFVSDRPLSKKELAKITKKPLEEIEAAIDELMKEYQSEERGIIILNKEDKFQLATNPSVSELVKKFLDYEMKEEITPAALETLAIIAYRGPITKEELDQIRGVNCSIILRHLMVKGLIDELKENEKILYNISFDFLKHLGLRSQKELPDYEKFHHLEIRISDLNQ